MADPKKIENAVKRVRDQKSFIQNLLIDALGWEIDEPPKTSSKSASNGRPPSCAPKGWKRKLPTA